MMIKAISVPAMINALRNAAPSFLIFHYPIFLTLHHDHYREFQNHSARTGTRFAPGAIDLIEIRLRPVRWRASRRNSRGYGEFNDGEEFQRQFSVPRNKTVLLASPFSKAFTIAGSHNAVFPARYALKSSAP